MKVLMKEPGKAPRQLEINNSLNTMQVLVGGYIEHLSFCVPGVGLIMNEEGKIKDMPFNFFYYGDDIRGTVLFVGDSGEEFSALTDEQVSEIRKILDED